MAENIKETITVIPITAGNCILSGNIKLEPNVVLDFSAGIMLQSSSNDEVSLTGNNTRIVAPYGMQIFAGNMQITTALVKR